jgi:hypothetical protein
MIIFCFDSVASPDYEKALQRSRAVHYISKRTALFYAE